MEIVGSLNQDILKTALHKVVHKHEILRTTFHCLPAMTIPLQVINDCSILLIENYDLSGLEPEQRENEIAALFQDLKQQNFDLKKCPLLHLSLVNLSPELHVLFVSVPALCADKTTLKNLMQEISRTYTACLHNEQLVNESVQYILFSEWQNELIETEEAKTGIEYWQQKNISHIFTLKLFGENQPDPSRFTPQIFTQRLHLGLAAEIEVLASKYDTSKSVSLLACWQILLWRLTGESDMIVGTDYDGRTEEELKDVLGLLTKYLPIHCHLDEESKFSEVVKQVTLSKTEMYDWPECFTWEQILGADATVIGLPFFPFCFEFEEQSPDYSTNEVSFSIDKQYACLDRFKIKLSFVEKNETLEAEFHYDSELFSLEDIQRLAGLFQTLLKSLIENPQAALIELEILSNVEQQCLLVEFNNTKTDFPQDKCLHQLFMEQVERTPEHIAVVFEDQQLTYAQLNARANQLAHYLQNLGVEPNMLVAVCLERSLEMVVGLLGVLKAGGAYLPLDSMYPQERLALMLEDSQAPMLLTQQRLLAILPEHQAQTICLDSNWEIIAQQSEGNPVNKTTIENLAYVIYTSGSTGKPKGAMLAHRAICNHMFWMQTSFPLTEQDKVLQKTPFSFDASIWEFYAPLLVGAQLAIARPGGHRDSNYLIKVIAEQQITILQLVPSLLQMLLEHGGIKTCTSLRRVFCGGETLPVALQKDFFTYLDAELHNLYGPTETCIDATFWTCQREVNQQIVPIGLPIANTQVYILDNQLRSVPIGISGELYIGGIGLAQGYLNHPELTLEKFIPNPFSQERGTRLYKTGDLARYRNDGNIEYLGRVDNQVKIRGFRIELGEIEAVLNTHPQIQQSVVVAQEDIPGNKRLVAYVSTSDESLTINQLREFIKQKLPEYMVPNAFVTLNSLPLTPNGKIDKKALPAPDKEIARSAEYVAPRTAIELQLTQIWSSVLNITPVGVKDNFFTLGGHSLLAVRLMSQIQQHFQVNLPLINLFQSPTIEQLAQLLNSSTDSLPWSVLVPIKSNGNQPPLFCIHPGGGNVLCYQDLAYHLNSEQPFYGLQSVGLNPKNQTHTSIEQMATHYIQELQTVQPNGPYFLSGWSLGGLIAFEIAQQLSHQGEQIALLALLDTYHPSIASQELEDNAALLVGLLGEDLNLCLEQLRQFEPQEQLIYVVEQAKQRNLVSQNFDLAQAHHLLRIFKLNVQAGKNYKPQYYSGSIVLFKASETDADLEFAWSEVVEHIETNVVPGTHRNMLTPPYVQTLVEKLQQSLEQAQTHQLEKLNAHNTQN